MDENDEYTMRDNDFTCFNCDTIVRDVDGSKGHDRHGEKFCCTECADEWETFQ